MKRNGTVAKESLMHADKARELSNSIESQAISDAISKIANLVAYAVGRAKTSVEINGVMKNLNMNQRSLVVKEVQALGYKIEDKSYSDPRESWDSWIVSW